jgi:hypothetical protein
MKAPADRLTLPVAAVVWLTGAVLHTAHIPALYVGAVGVVALPAAAYAVVLHRTHGHGKNRDVAAWRAAKAAIGVLAAGAWLACAAAWGAMCGPWCMSGLAWWLTALTVYAFVRFDEVTRERRDWRGEKVRWHQVSKLYGLQGSHLLDSKATRLGRMLTVDVTGTGRRASHLAARDTAERIAEQKRLPASRVQVRTDAIAGRIRIAIRERNPWEKPIPHPVLDDAPEIALPATQSIADPLIIGQDPETGTPLELAAYDHEDGAKAILIVSMRGGGKTVLLDDVMERLTACQDVLVWDICLSKAKENHRWAPACDLVAHGPHARRDALSILRLAKKAIEWRGNTDSDDAVHQPSAARPVIVIRVDELKTLLGGQSALDHALREVWTTVAEIGRSEGVVTIAASAA